MDRQPVLEGERLLLRPLQESDWDALYAVASDPLIWEVHPANDRWQEPVFRGYFADAMNSGGAMAVIDKASGQIVGSSSMRDHKPENGGSIEIGWTFLARSHWGGAHNREMKRLMLAHALRFVEKVRFRVGEGNMRSRRAMEKIGGQATGEIEHAVMAGREVTHVVFEITRESFAAGPLAN